MSSLSPFRIPILPAAPNIDLYSWNFVSAFLGKLKGCLSVQNPEYDTKWLQCVSLSHIEICTTCWTWNWILFVKTEKLNALLKSKLSAEYFIIHLLFICVQKPNDPSPRVFGSHWTPRKTLKQAPWLALRRPSNQIITVTFRGFRNLWNTKCSSTQPPLVVQTQWLLLASVTGSLLKNARATKSYFLLWDKGKRCNIWSQNFCLPRKMELPMTIESLFLSIQCISRTVTWTK